MNIKIAWLLIGLITVLSSSLKAHASETEGTIDPMHQYAWGENLGWINFNLTTVNDIGLSGYAWSANYGWINLSPENAGVTNDAEGNLSGYAWGEALGYIDFEDVRINEEGYFEGYAEGNISGRISLNCSNTNTCATSNFKVRTDWRPASQRNQNTQIETPTMSGNKGTKGPSKSPEQNTAPSPQEVKPAPFKDIEQHWSSNYLNELTEKNLMPSASEEFFEPDKAMTRAEFIEVVMNIQMYKKNLNEIPEVKNSSFTDVEEDFWAAPYIEAAKNAGFIKGYPNGTFDPNKPIKREEAALILFQSLHLTIKQNNLSIFPDVAKNEWYSEAIVTLQSLGIFQGYSNGTFGLGQAMTRAEGAKILIEGMHL